MLEHNAKFESASASDAGSVSQGARAGLIAGLVFAFGGLLLNTVSSTGFGVMTVAQVVAVPAVCVALLINGQRKTFWGFLLTMLAADAVAVPIWVLAIVRHLGAS